MRNVFLGKTIIVTGGASGIGAALVDKLQARGATVAVIDRSATYNGSAKYFQADMADRAQAQEAFTKAVRTLGSLDYCINNAGIFMGGEISDTPIDMWHTVIDNNIYAVAHGAHLAYRYMRAQGSGHIVNIASTAGLIPVPVMGIYGATKYALVGLSHAMRNEAVDAGVKVSVVCPTIVDTPLYDTALYANTSKHRLLGSSRNLQTAEAAAERTLRGVQKNQATIHTATSTKLLWLLYRIAPGLYNVGARRVLRTYRQRGPQ